MTKMLTGWAWPMAVAVLAGGLIATPARASKAPDRVAGSLNVYDGGQLFTPVGVDQAKATLSGTHFDHGLVVTVDTYADVPADRADAANAAKDDKAKWREFMTNWAKQQAQGDKAKGIYILITMKPVGGVAVIADRPTHDRGFNTDREKKVWEALVNSFRDANKEPDPAKKLELHDRGLKAAVDSIVADLKDSTYPVSTTAGTHNTSTPTKKGGGMGIGGWICLGLCVLAGVWLVIGIIRAFTGGGGGGGGGYGGGGYGGGGGGGFFSSMLGGLFGAAAGMYLYNNFFGGHSSGMMGGGGDAYAGDNYSGGGGSDGAGDFSGDTGAAGGFDNGGDTGGGGDWGGGGDTGGGGDWGDSGGGDMGGGGDWGGGGGDFGGGGGDF